MHAKWKQDRKEDFVINIGKEDVQQRMNVLLEQINNNKDTVVLERSVTELSDILVTAGSDHIKLISIGGAGGEVGRQEFKHTAWFDEECREQQGRFQEAEKRYHDEDLDKNRILMCLERKR